MSSTRDYDTILLQKRESVATITLNRPDVLNALNDKMCKEFIDVCGVVDRDDEVRVMLITGAGRAFCAGADIRERFVQKIEEKKNGVVDDLTNDWNERGPLALAGVKKPVIAAVNGLAVGWGCTVVLLCDIRIASEGAKFRLPFARVGLSPEMGSTLLLPRLVGMGKACELIFTAKMIDAIEAKEIGLVNQIVPADELMNTTYEMANSIAKLAPLAIRVSKMALYQGLSTDFATQVRHEAFAINYLRGTKDHQEGTAAVLEKREPVFKGE